MSQQPKELALAAGIEALLFLVGEPVEVSELVSALRQPRAVVEAGLEELAAACRARGIRVQRDGELVQLVTAPEAASLIARFTGRDGSVKLSAAALETLGIIAYRQPVTRGEIEAIRGVNADAVIATLEARGLIQEVGRRDGPGRPVLWSTTLEFLRFFGLESLAQLPAIEAGSEPAEGSEALL